jgi:glyoxylase-like metal-dependent hydrolase (beta-lactamase superfamily II)
MTHLHTDHAGGLSHFVGCNILVTRAELETASGRLGRARGYLNNRFPQWFSPIPPEFRDARLGPFPRSTPLTQAGDVHLVPTPGHTHGHMAVVIEDGDVLVFVAGDASYTEELMVRGSVDGLSPRDGDAKRTLGRIQALASQRPVVYLPSHDPDSIDRLTSRRVVAREPPRTAAGSV